MSYANFKLLIEACSNCGVSLFKCGDIEIHYNNEKKIKQENQEVYQNKESDGNIEIMNDDKMEKEIEEYQEVEEKEMLLLSNPEKYEEYLREK